MVLLTLPKEEVALTDTRVGESSYILGIMKILLITVDLSGLGYTAKVYEWMADSGVSICSNWIQTTLQNSTASMMTLQG
jgi:hypothetical protein